MKLVKVEETEKEVTVVLNTGIPASIAQAVSLLDVLNQRVLLQPDDAAYIFVRDDNEQASQEHVTYKQLALRVRAIAARLQALQIQPGERALLFYPQGVDYITAFLGCLFAGVVAVPTPHPHLAGLSRHLARLQTIVADARPSVVLTERTILTKTMYIVSQYPELSEMNWLATDTIADEEASQWHDPAVVGDQLAFLQYTSGSTSVPKGVVLTHRNLLHNHRLQQEVLLHPSTAPLLCWVPLYHDMGMIANALFALYVGAPCILLTPQSVIQRPLRWLAAISRYRVYTCFAPNFAYDLCLRKITPEQCAMLDLSCWRHAINGAEPVRATTIERFAQIFAECGLRPDFITPCYGLAEATVFISGAVSHQAGTLPTILYVDGDALEKHRVVPVVAGTPGARSLVSCGQSGSEHALAIVDPQTYQRCAADQVGEVWFQGPSVGQGYWQRPVESAATFAALIANEQSGPFLRTGDLGFLYQGELYITGRLKDMIIIDGRNHYPQDIEMTVEHCHPAIRAGFVAAFSVTEDEQEYLVIAAEVERHYRPVPVIVEREHPTNADNSALDTNTLRAIIRTIRRAVADEHEVTARTILLLKPATIHKTSSGKIQRAACRESFLANRLEVWYRG
jgi:acyl-CoA synthetase (AMP-forming)/AMP-acid ligase II